MAKIYAIGDSYVAGYGVNKGDDWVSLLSEKLARPIVNLGQNGAWICDLKSRYHTFEAGDILIVLGGCNDLLGGASVEEVLAAYEAFQNMAQESAAKAMILLPPMPDIVADELFVGMAMIESLKLKLIELYKRAEGYRLNDLIPSKEHLFFDGIHLEKRGHSLIAEGVYTWGKRDQIF